ncbi:MAG: hypothetical protein Q3976_04820 [Corynebacterium sp.]|nr:hypothetical protein [Corynebacterium sp.]
MTPHTNSAHWKKAAQPNRTPFSGASGMKRTGLLSAVLVGALVLTACGSDDVDDNDTSSSSTTTSTTEVSSAESSTEESQQASSSAEEAEETVEPSSETAEASSTTTEQANAAAPVLAKVDQDALAIRALVMGLNNTETLREYMEYIPLHTCSRVVNNAGGWESFDFNSVDPDLQAQLEASVENTRVDDVTNIVVNGTTATGDVTSTTAGTGTTSETMTFEYENNSWTFCQ